MKQRVLWIVAWVTATTLVVFAARSVDWTRTMDAARGANVAWLAIAVGADAAILVWWSWYWRSLVPRDEATVSGARMFEIVSVASALMNTMPFGSGHASSIALLTKRAGMTLRGAMSLLALDQLGEGLAKVSVFLVAALLVPLPTWMRAGVITASLGVGVWLVVLMTASRWKSLNLRELGILHRPAHAIAALSCVWGMKIMEGLAIVAVQQAFGVDVSLGGSILVLAAVILATIIPATPGNLGTYETAVFLAYRHLGVAPERAIALAVAQHVCFMVSAVGVGYGYLSAHAWSRSAIASR